VRSAIAYQYSTRRFVYNGVARPAWRTPAYRWPRGYAPRRYYRGQRLPLALILASYIITDYTSYGFAPPPPGDAWVRVGPDAVLVDQGTGDVADTVNGAFDESLPADADGAPPGYDPGQPPPDVGPPPPADLPPGFSEGRFELRSSEGCANFYSDPGVRDQVDGAWQAQDWNGVAATVAASQCRSDLSYYLLGMAAEGMGMIGPAFHYYVTALRISNPRAVSAEVRCTRFQDGCRGIDIRAEAMDGSRRTSPRQ
jgi:hypothetical protein